MTRYLKISESIPSMQIATSDSTVVVNNEYVQSVERLGTDALQKIDSLTGGPDDVEALKGIVRSLGNAVTDSALVLTQLLRGLQHGDIHVVNYPTEDAYTERQNGLK